jgi:hypothetical protein
MFSRRGLVLAAGAMVLSSAPVVAQTAEPIRLGAVLSTTGPAAWLGDPEDKTLRMYVEEINAAGGVIGRKIELFIYDDGSDAAKANSFGKRLIQQDKVDIILGASTTGTTMACAAIGRGRQGACDLLWSRQHHRGSRPALRVQDAPFRHDGGAGRPRRHEEARADQDRPDL